MILKDRGFEAISVTPSSMTSLFWASVKRHVTSDGVSRGEKMSNKDAFARFHDGSVVCTIWKNVVFHQGEASEVLQASVNKRYLDRYGVWRHSNRFEKNEIQMAITALQKAYDAMCGKPYVHEEEDYYPLG